MITNKTIDVSNKPIQVILPGTVEINNRIGTLFANYFNEQHNHFFDLIQQGQQLEQNQVKQYFDSMDWKQIDLHDQKNHFDIEHVNYGLSAWDHQIYYTINTNNSYLIQANQTKQNKQQALMIFNIDQQGSTGFYFANDPILLCFAYHCVQYYSGAIFHNQMPDNQQQLKKIKPRQESKQPDQTHAIFSREAIASRNQGFKTTVLDLQEKSLLRESIVNQSIKDYQEKIQPIVETDFAYKSKPNLSKKKIKNK